MKLELFVGDTCPFCAMVKKDIEKQGRTDILYRYIDQDDEQRDRLVREGGMMQVPCLFIDGKPLYESRDIVKWLRAHPQV